MSGIKKKQKKTVIYRKEGRPIIARIMHFFEEEYDFANNHILDFCDLTPLKYIRKRTADAVDIHINSIGTIMKEENKQKLKQSDSFIIGDESRYIIKGLHNFLHEEYRSLKENNHESCDLSILSNIKKRTAEATGASEEIVTMILEEDTLKKRIRTENAETDVEDTAEATDASEKTVTNIYDEEEFKTHIKIEITETNVEAKYTAKATDACEEMVTPIFGEEAFKTYIKTESTETDVEAEYTAEATDATKTILPTISKEEEFKKHIKMETTETDEETVSSRLKIKFEED